VPALVESPIRDPKQERLSELEPERFLREGGRVVREIELADEEIVTSELVDRADSGLDAPSAFDQSWLRSPQRPAVASARGTVRCADLFCGIGGLSVGLEEAAWSQGLRVEHVLAADADAGLLERYGVNFGARHPHPEPIETLVDGELGAPRTNAELELEAMVGDLDLVLAGPPCQGHSDLNNHTRRDDPRNSLMLRVARFAEVCRPRALLIENVPAAQRDKDGVVERTRAHLELLGYAVDSGVQRADEVGVAQRRRRFFLLASLDSTPSLADSVARRRQPERPVTWAIEDLGGEDAGAFESSAVHSEENRRRIAYLFEHGLYDLPDGERPACHRDKEHTYTAVYGRMRPDEPAPTITVGFGSTGQGRFVHPSEPRTLTPHEAARVQSFPDWFDFGTLRRGQLQKAIGNAVPPKLASAVLSGLLPVEPAS
jgi:DNA (cytosine-5)-methyltransferase 1